MRMTKARTPSMTLKKFLNAPVNSVTRERMFFNKLYFDLKLAAARHDYHLNIFEPEVDRDKFDVLLDDGDNERRIQLKTFTKSSPTTQWSSNKRFMRPDIITGDKLGIAPADCGIGGGFFLIEIDDSGHDAPVSYYYTDRSIIHALSVRLLWEPVKPPKRKGRPTPERDDLAKKFLETLPAGDPTASIALHKRLFLRVKSSDALLAIAGFHSNETCYLPMNHLLEAELNGVTVEADGKSAQGLDRSLVATVHAQMVDLHDLLEEPNITVFTRR